MPDAPTYEQLVALVAELSERNAELERLLSADSLNSSRPPSSDAPWEKKPAKKRSSRTRSGRNPGKQPGASSSSRRLVEDPDRGRGDRTGPLLGVRGAVGRGWRIRARASAGGGCGAGAAAGGHRVSAGFEDLLGCGTVTTPTWDTGNDHADVVSVPGSPVRIGPQDPGPVRLVDLRALPARGPGTHPAAVAVRDRGVHRIPRGHPGTRRPETGEKVPGAPARPAGRRPGAPAPTRPAAAPRARCPTYTSRAPNTSR